MRAALLRAYDALPRAAARRSFVLAVALLWPEPLMAQDITIGIDQARVVRLNEPGAEFIVGNPSIADISVQNSRLVVVTGKSFGSTSLIVLDADGREVFNRIMTVSSDPKRVVTLYKGGIRHSYECEPKCEPIIAPGDSPPEYVDALARTIRFKSTLATGTAEGSNVAE